MKHRCSICGSYFEFERRLSKKLPPNFPFCSERCKLIDLGKWLNGGYRISIPLPNADLLTDEKKQDIAQLMLETGEVEAIIYDDEVEQNDEK